MTLYRRTMTIIFESEEWQDSPVLMNKLSSYLHDDGISLVESYFYGTPDDTHYGLREVTTVDAKYDILINDKIAFTTDYMFRAKAIVDEMLSNDWSAEYYRRTKETTVTEWMTAPGSYAFVSFDDLDGEMTTQTMHPSIIYGDEGVELTTKIQRFNDDAFSLTFEIRKEIENITDRKNIENLIVSVPATDMKAIRKKVLSAIERLSEVEVTYTVDCTTEILSSVNYECSKDSIDLVMGEEE